MFGSILIANRGEIACRIIRTARVMGIKTVAIYSKADEFALHVDMANEAYLVGDAPPLDSYLNIENIQEVVSENRVEAVHPGYGFLSENAEFAECLEKIGVKFIGPKPASIRKMGDKIEAKKIALEAGVQCVPGFNEPLEDYSQAKLLAKEIGYPVMLKASAGGGGKGIRIVKDSKELEVALPACISEAVTSFGDPRVFIEKFIKTPRHIEIQVLADELGNTIHLGERECSIQRRHQKVIEEAPSPFLSPELREEMGQQSIALAAAVDYVSAGTVEFIVDEDSNFYFLEMNTRLQVEHPVTELVTGIDIVQQMIKIAAGEELEFQQKDIRFSGWALESRIYTEDPEHGFVPSIGRLTRYREPVTSAFGITKNVRLDAGVNEGDEINQYYDPMIAKLITHGNDREEAIRHMSWALDEYYIRGVETNLSFLAAIMNNKRFSSAKISTNFIEEEFGDKYTSDSADNPNLSNLIAVAATANRLLSEKYQKSFIRSENNEIQAIQSPNIPEDWVVLCKGDSYPIKLKIKNGIFNIISNDDEFSIETDWKPGQPIFLARINGELISLQIKIDHSGIYIRHSGFSTLLKVVSPKSARLRGLAPKQESIKSLKNIFSPMPGLITSINVSEGDKIRNGQNLLIIEAMKMENSIIAESSGKVKKITASVGDNVGAGDVLIILD